MSLVEVCIYIYTARERERCAISARNMLERAKGSERRGVVILKCLECIERERGALSVLEVCQRKREREREEGVVQTARERERCAVSARNMLVRARSSERRVRCVVIA